MFAIMRGFLRLAVLALASNLRVLAGGGQVEQIKKLIDSPLEDIQWVNERVVFILSEKGTWNAYCGYCSQ